MSYLLDTGCGQGIGFSIASLALQRGYRVVGITRSSNPLLNHLCFDNQYFSCIYSDLEQLDGNMMVISDIIKKFGFPSSVVLNAGMRCRTSIADSTIELAEKVLRVNTLSNYSIIKKLAQLKISSDGLTNILCVSSIVGTLAFRDLSLYAMSKSALEGFVRSASLELSDLSDDIILSAFASVL